MTRDLDLRQLLRDLHAMSNRVHVVLVVLLLVAGANLGMLMTVLASCA